MPDSALNPFNIVVLVGRVAREPFVRTLGSGDTSIEIDLVIPGPPAETVNVVAINPIAVAADVGLAEDGGASSGPDAVALCAGAVALEVDTPLLVVGRVRRRFFRIGGATRAHTEVVASVVLPAEPGAPAEAAVARAASRLRSLTCPPAD